MEKIFKIKYQGKEFVASNKDLDTLQLLVTTSSADFPPDFSVSAHGDYSDKKSPTEVRTWIHENLSPGDTFEFEYLDVGDTTTPKKSEKYGPYKERCNFCGKNKEEVEHLIQGKQTLKVYICNECVDSCVEIINAKGNESDA